MEGHFAKRLYAGVIGGYTDSDIHWFHSQGKGDIQTGYAGIYLAAVRDVIYGSVSAIGGWSSYDTKRFIVYPEVNKTASNDHGGSQLLVNANVGLNLGLKGFTIRPFDSFNYIAQKENGFTETGAGAYNLSVQSSNAILLRNELGLQFAGCLCFSASKWTLSPKISWIRECRIKGETYTSEFATTSVHFVTTGYFPDRSLYSPGVMVTGSLFQDRLSLELYYNGVYGKQYSDNTYGGQVRFGF
jgi:outer membrane autotransporter protein